MVAAEVSVVSGGAMATKLLSSDQTLDGPITDPSSFGPSITNVQMADLGGYTVARQLRSIGFEEPIMGLTVSAMPGDKEQYSAAGCSQLERKPVDCTSLLATCKSALQFSRKLPQ